jgi:hypothetical protein
MATGARPAVPAGLIRILPLKDPALKLLGFTLTVNTAGVEADSGETESQVGAGVFAWPPSTVTVKPAWLEQGDRTVTVCDASRDPAELAVKLKALGEICNAVPQAGRVAEPLPERMKVMLDDVAVSVYWKDPLAP